MTVNIRGLVMNGEKYVNLNDLLLWLSSCGELGNLSEAQREAIAALTKDLREGIRNIVV